MLSKKQIADKIETKLGYTNGWRIDDDKYRKLCLELANEIVGQIEPQVIPKFMETIEEWEESIQSEPPAS